MRWKFLTLVITAGCFFVAEPMFSQLGNYQSPYSIAFTVPLEELCAMDNFPPRNDSRLESSTPYDEWYSEGIKGQYGAWGPEPRHYPPIADLERLSASWKRQRVLAVAYRLIGLPYQHHHIPDWDPPSSWPWKPVAYGRNSKGVDCSDFTSWLYNYGLGIKLKTNVKKQAEIREINGPGDNGTIELEVIHNDGTYDDIVRRLRTGDLLYIKNRKGDIGHVIMWVGAHGQSPDGAPLIIDCTGDGHRDCNGNDIPIGVQLRPFLKSSWYFKNFAHAHRIIRE